MKIDLAQLARHAGVKRKLVKLRPVVPTNALVNDLAAIYMDSVRIWAQAAIDVLAGYELPAQTVGDAAPAQLQAVLDQASRHADTTIIYQTEKLGRWVTRVGQWHGQKTIAAAKSALGVDVAPFLTMEEVRPLLDASIAQNVSLIRGVNADTRKRLEQAVFDAFATRQTKKQLTDNLAWILGATKKRAKFIATDQMHKLNSALNEYRNQQLGITSYIWETQHDDRVRPAHRARDGKRFEWSKPPWDGSPGYAPGCRCWSAPIVDVWPDEMRVAA